MHSSARARACGALLLTVYAANSLSAQGARTLRPRDARVWAEVLAVHDARAADTSIVDSALASTHVALRAAGARLIGANRITARYSVARRLLVARDTTLARDAAFALGLAADTASCDVLRNALKRSHAGAAAAWALGEIGGGCGAFDTQFAQARAATVRAALLRVAVKWTPFPDAAVAAAYRGAQSHDERWAALWAFGRARSISASSLAFGATRDASPAIREMAARMLATRLPAPADSTAAMQHLARLVDDTNPHVRLSAARSIIAYGAAAVPVLSARWRVETDVNVRVAMAQAIGAVPPDAGVPWREWWQSDTIFILRRSLIASAWQADAIAALGSGVADSLDVHTDYRVRIAMIEGAASRFADASARRIAKRRDDPDPRVRSAVLGALASVSTAVRDSLDWSGLVATALRDDDPGVRRAALTSLSRSATARDVGTAVAAYQRAMNDSVADARGAALGVIVAAWRRDSLAFTDSSQAALRALAPAAEPSLRQRVLTVAPFAHWRAAPRDAPAVPAMYQRIVRTVITPTLRGSPPQLVIDTDRGPIRIELDGVLAPMTSEHLSTLARRGYFRALRFHRVVPAFVAQGGDPRGDGSGGPGVTIRDELNRSRYLRTAVGMALSGPDTGGSQFFLTLSPQPHLEGHYTVFGRVTRGAANMDALVQGDVIRNITPEPE